MSGLRINQETHTVSYLICHADMAQTPELLDASTDVRHRSYLAAVEGQQLHEVRPRVAKELLHLDDRLSDPGPRDCVHNVV
jgi:hypothetical protein